MFRKPLRLFALIFVVAAPMALMAMAAGPVTNAGWAELGVGSGSGGGISNIHDSIWYTQPSMAVDSARLPVIAWQNGVTSQEIYVRRWNGTAWVEMGAGSGTGGGISDDGTDSNNPSLAIGPDDRPIVAWDNSWNNPPEIFVRRWDGSAWIEMGEGSASGGGISNTDTWSSSASLAIGADGAPIVAWAEGDGNSEIYVRRWDGTAWAELGAGSATGHGISDTHEHSTGPFLAIDGSGAPIVAWGEGPHPAMCCGSEIFIRRWNGTAWVEMGAGSASGGGISQNESGSWAPSVAIDDDGKPIVAWFDGGSSIAEIYVRRWNGATWVAASPGSASGGGVSETLGYSHYPSLVVGLNGAPIVAWSEARFLDGHWTFVRYYPQLTYRAYSPLALSPAMSE